MKDELFLNNKVVTGLINSIESNGADLVFDETPLTIQSKAIGTDCMMKLANDSSTMIDLTKDYRTFVCNALVPSMRGIQRNINCSAKSVSGGIDINSTVTKTTTNVNYLVKKIDTNGAQVLSKSSLTDEELRKKYADYLTGDEAVDNEIIRLLKTYGEDLSELYTSDFDWFNNWSDGDVDVEITKKALSRIAEKDIEYIDGHLSNKKCANAEARVETILMHIANGPGAREGNVFNSELMNELKGYMSSDSRALVYLNALAPLQRTDYDYDAGLSYLDIKINGVGVVFTFENTENDGKAEILCFTDEDRTGRCMDYWESKNPGLYDYTLDLMSRDQIIEMYCKAENSADVSLFDNLLKSDGSYENVFTVDPDKISNTGAMVLGQYGCNLVELSEKNNSMYDQYYTFLNQLCSVHYEGDVTADIDGINENGYIEKYALGSSLVTDSYLEIAWSTTSTAGDSELAKQIEAAKKNELIGFSLYGYAQQADDSVLGIEVKLENLNGSKELHITDINRVTRYKQKEHTASSGLNNYGGDYLDTYWEIEKSSEPNVIQLKSMGGLKAVKEIAGDVIEDLNNKKVEMSKEVAADTAISVVGIFCEPAEKTLTVIKAINEGDMETIVDQGIDLTDKDSTIGKFGKTSITLYSAVTGYNSKLEDVNAEIEDLEDIQKVANFYTCNAYNFIGGDDNYYVKLDDLNMIRLVQNWGTNGITALYDNPEVYNSLDTYYDTIVGNVVKEVNQKDDSDLEHIYNFFTGTHIYTKEEIEKACNTLIYGSSSGKDTYASIMDIPTDLFTLCEEQMNSYAGEGVASIESEIEIHRLDYVAP